MVLIVETSNAEADADMYMDTPLTGVPIHTQWTSYAALFLTIRFGSARFRDVKSIRQVNAVINEMSAPHISKPA